MATAAQKSEKAQATQGPAAKAGLDTPTAHTTANLSRSWLKYVKDLPGAEKATGGKPPVVGGGEKKAKPPTVGGGEDTTKKPPIVGGGEADKPKLRDEPQPSTVHDGKKYETQYAAFGETVIQDGASLNDVEQGYLADCFLVASMGAIAMQRPDLIEHMIKDNGDGTVTVTLYTQNGALTVPGEGKPVEVRISMKLPSSNGVRPAYAKASSKELWPALIEKAYVAQFYGGDYQNANGGGSPGDAMTGMLGQASTDFSTKSNDAKTTVANVASLLKGGKPVVAASFDKNETDDALKKLADEKNVHAWHAYVVTKADEKTGEVELFNPWGSSHPQKLTAEEFVKLYTWVYVGNPKPPGQAPK